MFEVIKKPALCSAGFSEYGDPEGVYSVLPEPRPSARLRCAKLLPAIL
ncbi:hypothetical protein [Teredinibacter sp. KSP-S5-2]|nr:hypothetical protein [Teredinibacter sp. KSP-S5-2]WNO07690.1 hypothetical protein P5V12_11890 [Teredinibacter sp. KSP-S5-2]